MSFIQCKDEKEVDKLIEEDPKPRFVSPDHRIYDTIDFADEIGVHEIKAEEFKQIWELWGHIEMVRAKGFELPFDDLVEAANGFVLAFKECIGEKRK